MINFGGTTIYHLGDTALFSDLALVGRRDAIDVALMCIGGHYTMDRFDAVEAAELVGAAPGDPVPLQHVPADRDRRAGVQGRRGVGDLLRGRRPRAGGDAHAVTTALVLIQAERDAMATLGGALADVDGVAEAYSVTGRLGLRGDRARP